MSNIDVPVMTDEESLPFPSLASLREAHSELVQRRRADGDTAVVAEVKTFIQRARETGKLLDADEDRGASQSLLDYWSNFLYRVGQESPDANLAEFDPELRPEIPEERCPYLGLDAFREINQDRFFGRQHLVEKLVDKLRDNRLVIVVVGPSGSGKSSLVLAGLIPALKGGALPGSENWRYYPRLVPGSDPLLNLARAIQPEGANPAGWIQGQVEGFRQDPDHLTKLIGESDESPLVLVVDQFEEVFTLCRDSPLRQAFVDNLLNLTETPGGRHSVIMTMRTDFESRLPQLPRLQQLFEQAQVRVTPLNAAELREAIEKPAEAVGLKFEDGLVDALLQDLLGEPAALPLLQFTLLKLWENRERDRVTWEAYRRLGGGRLALANSADEFYNNLIPEDQIAAKRILMRLVRPGEGLEITSNRILRESLHLAGEARDRVDRALDKLVEARLVRLTQGDTPAADQIEIGHEALVRNWPRLVGWLDEERARLRERLRLTAAAEKWQAAGRDPGALWGEALIEDAERYEDLNLLETEFIQASKIAIEQAQQEKEAREEAVAKIQGQVKRYWRLLITLLPVLFPLVIILAIFATYQWQQAVHEFEQAEAARQSAEAAATALANEVTVRITAELKAVEAEAMAEQEARQAATAEAIAQEEARMARLRRSGELAAQALTRLNDQPDLALLLSVEAYKTADTFEARRSLLTALEYSPRLTTFLRGQAGAANAIALSPDGQTLASGHLNGQIVLWDLTLSPPLSDTLSLGPHSVGSVAFSPDGRRLASAGDGGLALWDIPGRRLLSQPVEGPASPVTSVAFSPDGRLLASGGLDNNVILWDVSGPTNPQPLGSPLVGHTGLIKSLAFSPDGEILASAGADTEIILWNVARRQPLTRLVGHTDVVNSVAFSPDSQILASGSLDRQIILWNIGQPDLRLGQPLGAPFSLEAAVRSVAFSPDGQTLASGSDDHRIMLWNIAPSLADAANPLGQVLPGHTGIVNSLAFSPDGRTLVSGSDDTTLIVWDMTVVSSLGELLIEDEAPVLSLAFNPADPFMLASGNVEGVVSLWNIEPGSDPGRPLLSRRLEGHAGAILSVAFSPDGQTLASGSDDGLIMVWDVADPQPRGRPLAGHTNAVNSVAFSPDGRLLASGSADQTIILWEAATGRPHGQPLTEHTGIVNSVAFNHDPDRQILASGSNDSRIILWDIAAGDMLDSLNAHTFPVRSLAFSPDDQLLASGSDNGLILIWDVNERRPLEPPLIEHTTAVVGLAFSPDGQTLASSSADNTIKLWSASARQPLGPPLIGHRGWANSVSFRRDRKILASGSDDGRSIVWDVDPDSWVDRACRIANRNLTPPEWQQYWGEGTSGQITCPGLQ